MPPALKLSAVSKSYASPVITGLDLELAHAEYIAIMGESGVGKSTLLNLIAGLDVPDSGKIEIEGTDITSLNEEERTRLRREKLGFVFQAFHLLPYLTVFQNVSLPLALNGMETNGDRVGCLLQALGLGSFADRFPREISGGEMQRVAIARSLVHRPKLVLADEPTGNLDENTARDVLSVLREQIFAAGAAGILITHSRLAASTADRIYIMSSGKLRVI